MDKMAYESKEINNDEEEVVGCGGSIRSRFNPSVTIALTA